MKISAALLLVLACAISAQANVKLPSLFSDHMVLQANVAAPVWGWAEPGEEVTVAIAGQTKKAKADADGRWSVKLDPLKTSDQPETLTVSGKNTLTAKDVLVGEVWLGSGQSNMALNVGGAKDPDQEAAAATFPSLRMFKVTSDAADTAQEDCKGSWTVCSPATVKLYSATAYFFGRELHQKLGVPVGLINSSVGGTRIESWISMEAQQRIPDLKAAVDSDLKLAQAFNAELATAKFEKDLAKWKETAAQAKAEGKPVPLAPRNLVEIRKRIGTGGGLFNGKIAPLIPYAIRGVVWYQGEANSAAAKAVLYAQQLPALIADWRTRWGSEFPFAWVQLPNFDGGEVRDWPAIRESMLKTLKVKNTGMAIAIDVGEAKNIHPKNKQEVGHRLALWALGTVYGKEVPSTSGPLLAGHQVRGSEVVLSFDHADGGLVAKEGELKGFVIAGEDKKWAPATAKIDGGKVVVSSPEVPKPVAVRYAWENNPVCNLYNVAGLPASPFRTDDWK